MKRSDLNHLRRLVAWVRCEIGQDPSEMQKTMIDIADSLGHPEVDDAAKARMVEGYRRAEAVPQYVRDAVKALDRYARPPAAASDVNFPDLHRRGKKLTCQPVDDRGPGDKCAPLDDVEIERGLAEIGIHVWGQRAEISLDAPAQVGNARFGKGVKWSTVIGAAQRHHAYMNTPEREAERIKLAQYGQQHLAKGEMMPSHLECYEAMMAAQPSISLNDDDLDRVATILNQYEAEEIGLWGIVEEIMDAFGARFYPTAQDQEDAQRYRWLRARWGRIEDTYDGGSNRLVEIREADEKWEGWDVSPESLDAAIEAARAKEE